MHSIASVGVPLDPVQNICADHEKGEKKRAWLEAFRDPCWGTRTAGCGYMCVRKVVEGGVLYAPVLCKTWSCGCCGPMRAGWLKRQLIRHVEEGTFSYFWTLTCRTGSCDPEESLYFVADAWHRLHRSLVREYAGFLYVWTRETTKKGYGHLHLLTNVDLSEGQLSAAWLKATGTSWVVDVQSVLSERAGSYMAKYCVSEARNRPLTTSGQRTRLKVYGKSRGVYFEPFVKSGGEGELVQAPWRQVRAELAAAGRIQHEKSIGSPWLLAAPEE
jgi:hypothetical protein